VSAGGALLITRPPDSSKISVARSQDQKRDHRGEPGASYKGTAQASLFDAREIIQKRDPLTNLH